MGAFPSKLENNPKSVLLGKEQPDLHTYSMNWRFILSADRRKEEEEEADREKEMESNRWGPRKKTISRMRAQIERQPLTTSCLGVTAQPHLSVCVPWWTQPEGQWLPGQLCICVACFHVFERLLACAHSGVHFNVCVHTHALASIAAFVYVLNAYRLSDICVKAGFISPADKVSKVL